MLTKITDDLFLDLEKVIRVAKDGNEVKYTIDYKERMVTYSVNEEIGDALLSVLRERHLEMLRPVEELIQEHHLMVSNSNGEKV